MIMWQSISTILRQLLHGAIFVLALALVALPTLRGTRGAQDALGWMLIASCVVFLVRAKRLRGMSVFMRPGDMIVHLKQQRGPIEPLFEPMEYVAWVVGVAAQIALAFL